MEKSTPKLVKVTTLEQARALPEPPRPEIREIDPVTGITTVTRVIPKFYPTPTDGDQILFFTDTDGRKMEIFYNENGPAKRELGWQF